MDVEKTSKDLVDECKVVSCEKERESGFCFQKYSKDEIFRIFHGLVYTPSSFEISEISKFRRKFRYFGVIFLVYTVALIIFVIAGILLTLDTWEKIFLDLLFLSLAPGSLHQRRA